MSKQQHVVIWDPSGDYWEGALVDAVDVAPALRARRVATLPVGVELIARSALGGWSKRSWGSGWPLSTTAPRMCCPLALYVTRAIPGVPSACRLNYCARLVPESSEVLEHVRAGGRIAGTIRLAADSGQPGAHAGGLGASDDTAVDAAALPRPDEDGGWTVYGGARIDSPVDGIFACGLYGAAPGLRVAWAAVSQSA
jgi:hypothetical protein